MPRFRAIQQALQSGGGRIPDLTGEEEAQFIEKERRELLGNPSVIKLDEQFAWGISGLPGCPCQDTWLFTAENIGITTLELKYYRQWESIENATQVFTINIVVI